MNIDRRQFFKVMAAGSAVAVGASPVQARECKTLPPDAIGILYDANLCIGCKACEVACKDANDMPVSGQGAIDQAYGVNGAWDGDDDLNGRTMNKIKAYVAEGSRTDLDDPDACFIKRACMHCIDPDCISACPVSALTKDPFTGIVQYNADACIGCRYCQLACPFNIPKFQYDKTFPQIVKCQMCAPRIADGEIPACCDVCPTGASLFGRVEDLRAEGHRRLAMQPGERAEFPLNQLGGKTRETEAEKYLPHLYGETESGGTQYLMVAGVPFEQLGMPPVGDESRARLSETLQHTLYKGMVAPGLLLGGLVYAAYQHTKEDREDHPEHDPESEDKSVCGQPEHHDD
ncbi:hydrogenase 2 operon protein HybA [Thiorhodovibrio frisius]|uniref:Fe-S-cluster-containing hydrogenase subunit n=1 Tax=Thiorhodovibrio frisius TaxID=631362 RepID=H8Z5L2_9GAMM|nr:hydrogenase 2 operon protein HybA [Thiorhodovibrio frisius]EIC20582.1 Fe-S-cluster-containing hydrogenase subunit [Thiorhodovibrio frisius]WPL21331.1 Formate dehydrogenase-N subunit beta [Thiorhodovibrio frisius]